MFLLYRELHAWNIALRISERKINIKFLLKNLEENVEVSNFALAFEKRPKRGSVISPEAEADGGGSER